ncbi:MAG: DUF2927 domain-containing protein [Silicimonas sp.]|nr:DUF2927 domain-containing protein [Silicimonas sp.]
MSLFGGGPQPTPPPPAPAPAPDAPSAESLELADYYEGVEQRQRTLGLLRTDGGGIDTPINSARLERTFTQIAFAREFTDVGAALVRRESDSMLHRWEEPVRIATVFGAQVPDMQRADDRASVQRFAARLARVTGHPIAYVERAANFHVLILTEEERRVSGPTLRRFIPGIRQQEIDVIQDLNRASYCVVVASDPADDGRLTRAVAIIRAELPPLLRLSCVHEEIAQGLGLANDSAEARPSIFNDDDEFGRLTTLDELMLKMLYDPRLRPGMDAATAAPTVAILAGEAFGGPS